MDRKAATALIRVRKKIILESDDLDETEDDDGMIYGSAYENTYNSVAPKRYQGNVAGGTITYPCIGLDGKVMRPFDESGQYVQNKKVKNLLSLHRQELDEDTLHGFNNIWPPFPGKSVGETRSLSASKKGSFIRLQILSKFTRINSPLHSGYKKNSDFLPQTVSPPGSKRVLFPTFINGPVVIPKDVSITSYHEWLGDEEGWVYKEKIPAGCIYKDDLDIIKQFYYDMRKKKVSGYNQYKVVKFDKDKLNDNPPPVLVRKFQSLGMSKPDAQRLFNSITHVVPSVYIRTPFTKWIQNLQGEANDSGRVKSAKIDKGFYLHIAPTAQKPPEDATKGFERPDDYLKAVNDAKSSFQKALSVHNRTKRKIQVKSRSLSDDTMEAIQSVLSDPESKNSVAFRYKDLMAKRAKTLNSQLAALSPVPNPKGSDFDRLNDMRIEEVQERITQMISEEPQIPIFLNFYKPREGFDRSGSFNKIILYPPLSVEERPNYAGLALKGRSSPSVPSPDTEILTHLVVKTRFHIPDDISGNIQISSVSLGNDGQIIGFLGGSKVEIDPRGIQPGTVSFPVPPEPELKLPERIIKRKSKAPQSLIDKALLGDQKAINALVKYDFSQEIYDAASNPHHEDHEYALEALYVWSSQNYLGRTYRLAHDRAEAASTRRSSAKKVIRKKGPAEQIDIDDESEDFSEEDSEDLVSVDDDDDLSVSLDSEDL